MSGSTGQIVGGVVGAVVGYFAGGNIAAGWAIGSSIGAVLDPEKVEGPRLQDRKVQVSAYGVPIPIIYGGDAGSGNIIWAADIRETASESGGKGGPQVTSYSYSVSCAVLIGEGPLNTPIPGLLRIWADAKLVYDVSPDADLATQVMSRQFAQYMTFYGGSEDPLEQLPDPTMQAALGADVPAYLGCCYVVFTDLPLADYGNRIPMFRFEPGLPTQAESSSEANVYEPLKIYPWTDDLRPTHSVGETEYTYSKVGVEYQGTDIAAAIAAMQANPVDITSANADVYLAYSMTTNERWSWWPAALSPARVDDAAHNVQYVQYSYGIAYPDVLAPYYNRHDFVNFNFGIWSDAMKQGGHTYPIDDDRLFWTIEAEDNGYWLTRASDDPAGFPDMIRVNTYPYTSDPNLWGHTFGSRVAFMTAERLPAPPPDVLGCQPGDPCSTGAPAQVPGDSGFCISCGGEITRNTAITYSVITVPNGFRQLAPIEYRNGVLYQNALGPVLAAGDPDWDNDDFWDVYRQAALTDGTLQSDMVGQTPATVSEVAVGVLESQGEFDTGLELDADLADIVTDICTRAGMPGGSYDVSALAGITVQGYTLARRFQARGALLPLQQAYWWDFVESGAQVKAVLRGVAPVAAITADDLGASEGDEQAPAVSPTRSQAEELPAEVTVIAPVRNASYEPGAQRAQRMTSGSDQKLAVELAVVMTPQRAADVAAVLMYNAWSGRTTREFSTTRKWAHLEPTDVITVNDGEFTSTVRIIERTEDGPVIRWKAVDELPAAYDPLAEPGIGQGGISGIRFAGPTKLVLLDIPIVRDADDAPGLYAAVAGYTPDWRGGAAFRSYDAGSTWALVQDGMDRAAAMGYATTALGNWTGGNMPDEANTVAVSMHSGSLATVTHSAVLAGANVAVLGSEIIQFRVATLVSAGVYQLSGLLRGRRGTEQHMATHAEGDAFVLLTNDTTYRLPDTLAKIGLPAVWNAVTAGQTLATGLEQDHTHNANGLKPLSPVHLHATPIDGTTLRITWQRRTRVAGEWLPYVDAQLGEATESYLVRVVSSGGTTISEQTVSAKTADVALASAPIGSGAVITVQQLSASVGPGFAATITI